MDQWTEPIEMTFGMSARVDPRNWGQFGGISSAPWNTGNIEREPKLFGTRGGSSDAAFRCQYCSNLIAIAAAVVTMLYSFVCCNIGTSTAVYFASAAVAVDSSHMTASSSASCSRFSPPSYFIMGTCRQCGSWCVAGQNHRKVIGRDPVCAR